MIKLFEQWLQEESSEEVTLSSTTKSGQLDVVAVKNTELSSQTTTTYLVSSSKTELAKAGDTIMISKKDPDSGAESDIIVTDDPNDPSKSKQLVGTVTISKKSQED